MSSTYIQELALSSYTMGLIAGIFISYKIVNTPDMTSGMAVGLGMGTVAIYWASIKLTLR